VPFLSGTFTIFLRASSWLSAPATGTSRALPLPMPMPAIAVADERQRLQNRVRGRLSRLGHAVHRDHLLAQAVGTLVAAPASCLPVFSP
jgi:hypothetical protein